MVTVVGRKRSTPQLPIVSCMKESDVLMCLNSNLTFPPDSRHGSSSCCIAPVTPPAERVLYFRRGIRDQCMPLVEQICALATRTAFATSLSCHFQPKDIFERLSKDPEQVAKRPLLSGDDPLAKLEELTETRRSLYGMVSIACW